MSQHLGDITLASAKAMMPELFLAGATLFLLVYSVYRAKQINTALIALAVLVLGCSLYLSLCGAPLSAVVMNGMFVTDRFTLFVKCLILIAGVLTLLLSTQWLREEGGRPVEFLLLMLFAMLGMMLTVSANDLLALYMAMELSSLSLYVLAAFRRDDMKSSEAGLKYFVLGALASGMLLFGMSLVYGFAGTTNFTRLASLFASSDALSPAIIVGMILVLIGFCFKLSAVPFHMWTPDVYEGAPTPVTAFFATAPKVAALAIFIRLLLQPFDPLFSQWQQIIIFAAVASMLTGALAAIMQTNIKRLLAYSSIGHVGYMLMGLAAGTQAGVQAALVYVSLYIFMSAGMFACLLSLRRNGAYVEEIKDLAGLSRSHPALAMAIAVFMFSMAGIPPVSGFFGKLYVVLAAVAGGLTWLAVLGVMISVIGCYYYLKIIKVMYFDEADAALDSVVPCVLKLVIAFTAGITLFFFLLPSPLIAVAKTAAQVVVPK